jgi:hypothetical protein
VYKDQRDSAAADQHHQENLEAQKQQVQATREQAAAQHRLAAIKEAKFKWRQEQEQGRSANHDETPVPVNQTPAVNLDKPVSAQPDPLPKGPQASWGGNLLSGATPSTPVAPKALKDSSIEIPSSCEPYSIWVYKVFSFLCDIF